MRSLHRTVRSALSLTTGLALALAPTLATSTPAAAGARTGSTGATTVAPFAAAPAAPAAPAGWTLMDYQQAICIDAAYGRKTYFWIFIAGDRPVPITIGAEGLPAGSESTSVAIPPGSNGGSTALAGVWVSIPPIPVGVYTAALYTDDGVEKQTVPITIRSQQRC